MDFTDTLQKIDERKAMKAAVKKCRTRTAKGKAHEEYKGVNRNDKSSLRQTNATFWSPWQQKYVEICGTFMLPSRKYSKPERPVKDKDGQPMSDSEGQKKRWVEHFEARAHLEPSGEREEGPNKNLVAP